jgi:hypothetical protein
MKTIVTTVTGLAHSIAALPAFQHTSLDVFAISAYESGFNHGVIDGNDYSLHPSGYHWYILEPGKGFAFHSKEFARGFVNNFCSVDPNASNDADQATLDCDKGPESTSWIE